MKPDIERAAYYNAPLHVRRKHMHVHLSENLRKELSKRAALVKTGDVVKILVGSLRGKEGKVARVDYVKRKVYIEGITLRNARGDEILRPFHPSNLMIISLGPKGVIKKKKIRIKKEDVEKKKADKKSNDEKKGKANVKKEKPEKKGKDEKKEKTKKGEKNKGEENKVERNK